MTRKSGSGRRRRGGTRDPGTASPPRGARLRRLALVVGLLVLTPLLIQIAAQLFVAAAIEEETGHEASVGLVRWRAADRVEIRDLRLDHPRRDGDFLSVERLDLPFAAPIWSREPRRLLEVTAEGLVLELRPGDLAVANPAAAMAPAAAGGPGPGTAAEAGTADAPTRSPGPERLRLRRGRILFVFPRRDAPDLHVPVEDLELDLVAEGGGYRMEGGSARLLGGAVSLSGGLVGARPREGWSLQARIADADLSRARGLQGVEAELLAGELAAFVDLKGAPQPAGAGWIDVRKGRLWELPVLGDVVGALGLAVGLDSGLQRLRTRFFLERGRVDFAELRMRGSPLGLVGRGSMRLDGSRLEADLVPRVAEGLTGDLPVVGAPTQTLLDLVKGAAVEVRLRGRLGAPEVETLPLPFLTRAIEDLFAEDDER